MPLPWPVEGPSFASVKQVGQHHCLIDLELGVQSNTVFIPNSAVQATK